VHAAFVLDIAHALDAIPSTGFEVEADGLELAVPALGQGAAVNELLALFCQVLSD
jgi:hypothetical protein